MISDEIMLKVENVSKVYKLGEIGGTTLRDELQRFGAKIRHKPDPTKKVGAKDYNKGEMFNALDGVSFKVKKGERIGIIGHNGAGKSTLLKLISRVTGPTSGTIYLNGRVASMLEVGTGFHPELTGRENIYMNGAILGMTKKEIDAKMDEIIEFSEVRQFIDTPVKRYSSGMYVKLAFSVAAHLDSEIVIMDEVLAVGDAQFQRKCINKMKTIADEENKTILYVSHNMSTIRQLCDRVVVLNKGKIIFDGGVEEGIAKYMNNEAPSTSVVFNDANHKKWKSLDVTIKSINLTDKESASFVPGEPLKGTILIEALKFIDNLGLRFEISNSYGQKLGTSFTELFNICEGNNEISFSYDTSLFVPGRIYIDVVLFLDDGSGGQRSIDGVYPGMIMDFFDYESEFNRLRWRPEYWGSIHLPDIILKK